MSRKVFALAAAIIVVWFVVASASAAPRANYTAPGPDQVASHTEVAVLPPADMAGGRGAASRSFEDLRDSAALVLVGTMLIGLAAAVRRTA